jgi:hypothetical protein
MVESAQVPYTRHDRKTISEIVVEFLVARGVVRV